MSKRSLASSSASSSPRKNLKKPKLAHTGGQSRLDAFFGGASTSSRPTHLDATPSPRPPGPRPAIPAASVAPGKGKDVEQPLTDEQLAWALATADGLDLEALRQLEDRGTTTRHLSPAPLPDEKSHPEVIDVDALSDGGAQSSSKNSSSRQTTPAVSAAPPAVASSSQTPRSSARFQGTTIGNATPLESPTYDPLNVDPSTYDAARTVWPPDAPVPYSFLAHTLATLSGTRSRIAKLDTLTNALRTICRQHPPSLLPALYLVSNSLSPPYSPIELGLGPSIIHKAIQHVSGLSSAALKRLYNQTGDPGKLQAMAEWCPPPLTRLCAVGRRCSV